LPEQGDITQWLIAAREGDAAAMHQVFALVYPQLRRLAHGQRIGRGQTTLDTTGLVHECFLRLARADPSLRDREHFLALAARVMRQVIVDYARERLTDKRGGGATALALDQFDLPERAEAQHLLEVHDLLEKLAAANPRQARVVECRFFAGLSEAETAEALGISERSVQRDWSQAREWLQQASGASD
jgi:RNA polymerase sigma factor (TIGR02999 family)